MYASAVPEFWEEGVEQAEKVGYSCAECYKAVHVCSAVFCLFVGVDEEVFAENEQNWCGEYEHVVVGIGYVHEIGRAS